MPLAEGVNAVLTDGSGFDELFVRLTSREVAAE